MFHKSLLAEIHLLGKKKQKHGLHCPIPESQNTRQFWNGTMVDTTITTCKLFHCPICTFFIHLIHGICRIKNRFCWITAMKGIVSEKAIKDLTARGFQCQKLTSIIFSAFKNNCQRTLTKIPPKVDSSLLRQPFLLELRICSYTHHWQYHKNSHCLSYTWILQ